MDNFQCEVCGNKVGNSSYLAREMMFGLRDQFLYFQCSHCGCLQIAEIPKDMRPYYPSENYYSYKSTPARCSIKSRVGLGIRKKVLSNYLRAFSPANFWLIQILLRKKEYKWLVHLRGLKLFSDILDVGSGTGLLLLELNKLGFKNLTGIDPFIDHDLNYSCGVKIVKKNLSEVDKQYDLVMLNHAFEHMDQPKETFEQLYKQIKPGGWLLIRIPVVDCFSWRKYGVSWFQLDAPRHLFLHSVRSMSVLATHVGLDMFNIGYDSNEAQFYQSEKYIRNKSLLEKMSFEPKLLKKWKKQAAFLNSINDGDQACFIFKKNKEM